MRVEVLPIRKIDAEDVVTINHFRLQEFGIDTSINQNNTKEEQNSLFFLLKDDDRTLLAFALLEELPLRFHTESLLVLCVSTVIATQRGNNYGIQVLMKVQQYAKEKGRTVLGFCETDLIPFYQKCGFDILSNEDNQFMYCDESGKILPHIVPGEVFYLDGHDKVIESILSSSDKRVLVSRRR